MHRYPQGCKNIDWKEENPEWESKTCAPTYSCLENPQVDLTNAAFISNHEMPYENAPEVNPPIFPLIKDFNKTIVFANNARVEDTVDSCQYTCNDGFRVSTGACGTTPGTGTGGAACSQLQATITQGGSGYTTIPTVTLSSVCPNTITATATLAGGIVTGVTFGGTGTCTSVPTLTITPPTTTSSCSVDVTQKIFTDPKIGTRPVYARSGSPARFCAEQGFIGTTTVKQVYNYTGDGAIWGEEWVTNNGLEAIKEVECTNAPNTVSQKFTDPLGA